MKNSLGPITAYNPPSMAALQNYDVNRAGQHEVIWQPLYDYQVYPTTGQAQFVFFQNTIGLGGLTLANTNMEAAGQMPKPKEFLCTGIQVYYRPGNAVSISQGAAGTPQRNWIDVNQVMQGLGWLVFFIGSKDYLRDSPLAKFTQQFRLDGAAAITGAGTVATTDFVDYAVHCGRYYSITPVKLPSNQNFNVSINFNALVTTTVAGRIGVILDGFQYRLSQ